MSAVHECRVEAYQADQRLDKYLSTQLPHLTRSHLQRMVEQGAVTRDGIVITNAASKVREGQLFVLTEPETKSLDLTPEAIALDIIYEDDTLIVINKAAGMTVHPAPGAHTGTLVHALLAHCGDTLSGIGGVARPGIVHRIDKDTSGLLVVAKTDAAHQALSAQLKERTLKRHYIAFCWGGPQPRSGAVEAPLARHPRQRKQMAVVENGRYALTNYETEISYNAPGFIVPLASKIHCELDTGRTHQIRVHMAHIKCPLIGDNLYGQTTTTRLNRLKAQGMQLPDEIKNALHSFNRQALHAAELTLIHPETNEEMLFEAPLPGDLLALQAALATLTK
jgi:23S rRNA pseudouridine1911/1915/1917 synthase